MRELHLAPLVALVLVQCLPPELKPDLNAPTGGTPTVNNSGSFAGGGLNGSGNYGSGAFPSAQGPGGTDNTGGTDNSTGGTNTPSGGDGETPGGSSAIGGGGSATGGGSTVTTDDLVDDMEDADAQILMRPGRNGYWYVGDDGTEGGVAQPPSGKFNVTKLEAGERSKYAAQLQAIGFTDWGSVIGFNFAQQVQDIEPYDASAYCGLRFWARASTDPEAAPKPVNVRVRFPDENTDPAGGICSPSGGAATSCYDHFGITLSIGAVWKLYSVAFSSLAQLGTGYHPASKKLSVDAVYEVEWALPADGQFYEIVIDDVTLYGPPAGGTCQ